MHRASLPAAAVLLALLVSVSCQAAPQTLAPGGWGAVWAPDGAQIAFLSNFRSIPPDLWVTTADGQRQRRLTTSGARTFWWSRDGRSVVIASKRTGRERWWQVDLDTGIEDPIWEFLPERAEDVIPSPDGTLLAYTTREGKFRDLWVIISSGTRRRGVTRNFWVRAYLWTPDARQLLFVVGRVVPVALWRYRVETGEMGQLYSGFAGLPAVSPDGTRVAFPIPRGGGAHDLVVLDLRSGTRQTLKLANADGSRPAWSADSQAIAYVARDRTGRVVTVVSVSGGKPRRITADWLHATAPSWSPDGRRLLVEETSGGDLPGDLFVIDTAGRGLRRLTRARPAQWNPAWSADGRRLAYLSDEAGQVQVWATEGNGGQKTAMGPVLSQETQLSWAPGARRLLSSGRDVRIHSPDGNAAALISPEDGQTFASWAPSGSLIAYTAWESTQPSIRLLDPHRRTSRMLASAGAYPSWSPDGRLVAYAASNGLWVIRPGGTSARQLLAIPPRARILRPPVWSADGSVVVTEIVVDGAPPRYSLWRVEVAAAKSTTLFSGSIETEFAAFLSSVTTPPAMAAGRVYFSWMHEDHPAIWTVAPGSPPRLFRDRASSPAIAAGRLAYVSFTDQQRIVVEEMTSP